MAFQIPYPSPVMSIEAAGVKEDTRRFAVDRNATITCMVRFMYHVRTMVRLSANTAF